MDAKSFERVRERPYDDEVDGELLRLGHALVERAEDGDATLTPNEWLVLCATQLDAEVRNGGHDQYFFNSASEHYPTLLQHLTRIGALADVARLTAAKTLFFGDAPFATDTDARRQAHTSPEEGAASERAQALDRAYSDGDGQALFEAIWYAVRSDPALVAQLDLPDV